MGEDQQDGGCTPEGSAEKILDDHIQMGGVAEEEDDKVGKQDSVLVVLGPQCSQGQRAIVRTPKNVHIGPLIVEKDIGGEVVYVPCGCHRHGHKDEHRPKRRHSPDGKR